MSKTFAWDADKNDWLQTHRGFGFEDIVLAIDGGGLLVDIAHPSTRFRHQRIMVVNLEGYAIVVPYVENHDTLFLKTAYPDRKATKRFLAQ